MVEIDNIRVYDLKESVIACKYAMQTEPQHISGEQIDAMFEDALPRAKKLAKQGGGTGNSNFRKGIRVSFDLKYPNYFSPELQRYKFVDIVCSSSKMHKLMSMNMDKCFNKYVTDASKTLMGRLVERYNKDKSYENFMLALSNCPMGVELFMRCSTNYEQLATIYRQRYSHKLKEDWGAFITFIRSLPYSNELIICG